MRLFRLENNNILKGVPLEPFQHHKVIHRKGIAKNAAVSLVIPEGLSRELLEPVLAEQGNQAYTFCEAWLRRATKNKAPQEALLMINWLDHWPDKGLGDASTLISWKRNLALYHCVPDRTFIRERGGDGRILCLDSSGKFFFTTKSLDELQRLKQLDDLKDMATDNPDNIISGILA